VTDLDPQLERKNVLTGLALLALALLLFAGTFGIALLYLHFD
jgi:hypothetical protein